MDWILPLLLLLVLVVVLTAASAVLLLAAARICSVRNVTFGDAFKIAVTASFLQIGFNVLLFFAMQNAYVQSKILPQALNGISLVGGTLIAVFLIAKIMEQAIVKSFLIWLVWMLLLLAVWFVVGLLMVKFNFSPSDWMAK